MKPTVYEILKPIIETIEMNHNNHEEGDLFRTNFCAGYASGQVEMLKFFGIEYDFGTYSDGEYHLVGYLRIEDAVIVKNGEVNWRVCSDKVRSDWSKREAFAE